MCHVSVKAAAESAHGRFKAKGQVVVKIMEATLSEKMTAVSIKSGKDEGVLHSCSFLCASR